MKKSSNKELDIFQQKIKIQNGIKQEIKYTYLTTENIYRKKKKSISRSFIIIQFPNQNITNDYLKLSKGSSCPRITT